MRNSCSLSGVRSTHRNFLGRSIADIWRRKYGTKPCIVTLVERKTGYVLIGKLEARTKEVANRRTLRLIKRHPERFATITADNGAEFHGYEDIERLTEVKS